MVERGGVDTGELEPPPLPPGCSEVYELFWQLRRQAGSNGMTHNAIKFSEILAWQTLTGAVLDACETDLVFAMDNAAIAAFAQK